VTCQKTEFFIKWTSYLGRLGHRSSFDSDLALALPPVRNLISLILMDKFSLKALLCFICVHGEKCPYLNVIMLYSF
jgi:hypothetical protein